MTHRIAAGVERGAVISLAVDGRTVMAHEGETIAAAMLAAGIRGFRRDSRGGWRAPYCNMGVCQECRVRVEPLVDSEHIGAAWVRACMTPVQSGMVIRTDELP